MALGYQNPFYLKQAQQKQQSLYNGKVLLEKHDPPTVYDSEETLELAQESRLKMKQLNKEIKPANYTKINHLSGVFVSQTAKSREELYLSNASKMANVFNSILIPNEEFSDDTTPNTSNLQTELERTKERFENCIIKKENEYAKLWNDWYKKCKECKYDKISYDKAYNDMQQKIERLQAQLGDQKGKGKNTPCVSDTLNPFPRKLENGNVELEFQNSWEEKFVPSKPINASVRTNSITVPQPHVITKKVVNSDSNGFSSTGVDIDTKNKRSQPRSNTKNDRVPSASKSSCIKNKEVEVEEHHRTLLLSKNKKHMSSECNNIKLVIRNDKSEIVCAMCKQCLITANHDVCLLNYVDGMNSRSKKQKANVSNIANQTKHKPQVWKPKNAGSKEILASPKPSKPRMRLRWSPTGRIFDLCEKLISSSDSEYLKVAFRRNTCFVKNLEGVDLLIGNRTTNLYIINLHDMAFASPIYLMARATSTKSWLWHQRLSHLNFDTINVLARNNLVTGLPKFKYHKEHLCPSCEQGKSKRASHPPKPVLNSKQSLHLLHMDLCGPMRIASINEKWYVLVIVDDYSRYTWAVFLISKDEAPEEIKTFLKKITVLLQALVIIVRTENGTEFKNQVLQEYFNSVGISHQASYVPISTACYTQNCCIIHRRFDKTPYELINGRKLDISFLYVFGALCYPKNDREDIEKLGAKGDIGFFIGYSANSCAYRVYNRRTMKIMETMNVTFDELSAMAFEQSILQTPAATTTTTDTASTPTNSSSQAISIPTTSQNVDELKTQQQHVQHQPATIADNVSNAMFDDNLFVNPFATPSTSDAESSSSQYVDPLNMHTFYQPYPHEYQWTKDHPLEQVIGEPS
ncbi:retrovirus-related pol polyprotein from transposon TNT 1-94 [Tanacetum coccineum]